MQIAECLLILNEYGSCVPKKNITPAEAQFLVWSHQENARQMPIKDLMILDLIPVSEEELSTLDGNSLELSDEQLAKRVAVRGHVAHNDAIKSADSRTSAQEKLRLKGIYKPHSNDPKAMTVEKIWPGANSALPKNFSDVVDEEGRPVFGSDGSVLSAPVNTKSIEVDGEVITAEEIRELRKKAA